jgi:hypothetical protein
MIIMAESQLFFIKTIDIIPVKSQCIIGWYSNIYTDKVVDKINGILNKDGSQFTFLLTEEGKLILENASKEDNIEEHIFFMEINKDGLKLFEAYDSFEIGIISPIVKLPADYIKEFVDTGMCFISL